MPRIELKLIIISAVIFIAASLLGRKPDCYQSIIPENLPTIKKECPELFKTMIFCVADHGACSKSSKDITECNNMFKQCVQEAESNDLSFACKGFLLKSIKHISQNGGKCRKEQIDEVVEEVQNELMPIASVLFNKTTLRALYVKRLSGNFGSLSDVIGMFVPFLEATSLDYREDSEALEAALLRVEQNNLKGLGIPFSLWHGGLGQKQAALGKVIDRVLVNFCCGYNVSQEINHAWARCSDCLSTTKNVSCTNQLILTLQETATNSTKGKSICNIYAEAIQYASTLVTNSFHGDELFQYVSADRVLNEGTSTAMLRSNHLSLLNLTSSPSLSYKKCYAVRRTLSSCEFDYHHCEKLFGKDCLQTLSKCHMDIAFTDADAECKETLVFYRSFWNIVVNWYSYTVNNIFIVIGFIVAFFLAVCGYINKCLKVKENLQKFYEWLKPRCVKKNNEESTEDEENTEMPPVIQLEPNPEGPAPVARSITNNNENGDGEIETVENNKRQRVRFWNRVFWRDIWRRFVARFHRG